MDMDIISIGYVIYLTRISLHRAQVNTITNLYKEYILRAYIVVVVVVVTDDDNLLLLLILRCTFAANMQMLHGYPNL